MTERKSNKEYDFEIQCEEAGKAEEKLKQLLLSGRFELKTERHMWHDTGNIVIEYESHGQPSGIAATKADYWAHELRSRSNETLAYIIFPTPILRNICNKLMDEDKPRWRRGGENNQMEMLLLDLEKILVKLQYFSGCGDDTFPTRKEREAMKSKSE